MAGMQGVSMPTHIVALGGSLLRPEEEELRAMWFGQLRQLAVHFEGNGRKLGIVVGVDSLLEKQLLLQEIPLQIPIDWIL